MKLGRSRAAKLAKISNLDDLKEAWQVAQQAKLPIIVLGEGSNSLATDQDITAMVIINQLTGWELTPASDNQTAEFVIQAGQNLDQAVEFATSQGWCGIESLAAIPGTAGAAPVQNVGAYGQEIAETLLDLTAFDLQTGELITITKDQCEFGYRDSIFKRQAKNRYCITQIRLKLHRQAPKPPFYQSLQAYLDAHEITEYSPQNIYQAVSAVRAGKIPDYRQHPSAGSFFKHAIIDAATAKAILADYPDLPTSQLSSGQIKIPSGWLLEQAGFKGQTVGKFLLPESAILILVNQGATDYQQLLETQTKIEQAVWDKFGVKLEPEPIKITP